MNTDWNKPEPGTIGKTRRTAGPARGVLHRHLAAGRFQHARLLPSAPLQPWIEHFWHVCWDLDDQPPQVQATLPHPNVQVVFERGASAIFGVHTGRFTRVLQGRGQVFGIKFKAGAFRPWLGGPVSGLMNRSLPLVPVFGGEAATLEEQLLDCGDAAAMADLAERFLLPRLPAADPQAERAEAIVSGIVHDRDLTSVQGLADRSGLGVRALQRLFSQYVGATPKWVINRYRMHEAVQQLQSGAPVAWAALAQELGYFDQAHFIRDFKRLVGRTPADYARDEGPPRA